MKPPRKLTWKDISVEQFLDIYRLSLNTDLDEMGKLERCVCIVFDKTERELDEMMMGEFTRLSAQVAFVLNEAIPGKAVRRIKVGKNRYSIVYNPAKLRHRQYVEITYFSNKPIDNMHLIMASIVEPITWYGKKLKNESDQHETIASDLLKARVVDVYHSAVFFCNLLINSMISTQVYLVQLLMTQNHWTKEQAEEALTASISAMAGFIPPEKLRILKT